MLKPLVFIFSALKMCHQKTGFSAVHFHSHKEPFNKSEQIRAHAALHVHHEKQILYLTLRVCT